MANKILGIEIASVGATHPRPEKMKSLEQVFAALEAWGVRFDKDYVKHNEIRTKKFETMRRCGMLKRWYSGLTSTQLARIASTAAIHNAEIRYEDFREEDISLLYCGGSTLPRSYPAQSVELASLLGIPDLRCRTRDISGACASMSNALVDAYDVMLQRQLKWGMISGGEVIGSRGTDPRIAKENFAFWDDNGASLILRGTNDPEIGIIAAESFCCYKTFAESIGSGSDYVKPINLDSPRLGDRFMHGAPDAHLNEPGPLYDFIVTEFPPMIAKVMEQHDIGIDDRTFLVGHGANKRATDKVGSHKSLGFNPDNVLTMLAENGRSNMSSVSWMTTLDHYGAIPNFFRQGDVIIIVTYSAGLLGDVIIVRLGEHGFHVPPVKVE